MLTLGMFSWRSVHILKVQGQGQDQGLQTLKGKKKIKHLDVEKQPSVKIYCKTSAVLQNIKRCFDSCDCPSLRQT